VKEFEAHAVGFLSDPELEAEALVLAEREDGSGHRVELQAPLVVTDQDRRLGQDTYCLVDETGATHNGGLDAWSLDDGVLELRLSDDAAQALGIEGGYRIHLSDPETSLDVVKGGPALDHRTRRRKMTSTKT
jgi:Immunity protein 10